MNRRRWCGFDAFATLLEDIPELPTQPHTRDEIEHTAGRLCMNLARRHEGEEAIDAQEASDRIWAYEVGLAQGIDKV